MRLDWKIAIVPLICAILLLSNINNFYFWDTIQLSSKHAHWFYENQFSSFFLPVEINSGHPPFFGMFLAISWFVFGKSLWVGHTIMLIFCLASISQLHQIGKYFVGKEKAFIFPIVVYSNPVFLGHAILVSPDNILVFLLLWSINSYLTGRKKELPLALLFLSMISIRGMIVVFAFFLFDMMYKLLKRKKLKPAIIVKYLPAGILAVIFFSLHFFRNRWIGFHDDSPWATSFDLVSINGFIYNLGLIGWRLLDFGNVFLIAGILILLFRNQNFLKSKNIKHLLLLFLAFSICFIPLLSIFQYLTGHRYFFPLYLIISLIFAFLMVKSSSYKLGSIVLILLFLGNFWIYPRNISQGWDVSLAHVPFYNLTHQMYEYISEENIDPTMIGTEFPLKSDSEFLHLSGEFPTFHEVDLEHDKLVLYSRVMNDFKEREYSYLEENFHIKKKFDSFKIDLILYERN